jgi:hypothetical protein
MKNSEEHNKVLSKMTLMFLAFCILGVISHNEGFINEFGQIPFIMFIVAEILYLWFVMKISLKSKALKGLFSVLFGILLLPLPFYIFKSYNETLYDPLFAAESLLASSVSYVYFTQLGDEIKLKNVLTDKITLVMLGLFFCYSLPFAYNTTITAINFFEPSLFNRIKNNSFDFFLLITISRVGTVCYIILNIFFYKAFKWKPPVQIGT